MSHEISNITAHISKLFQIEMIKTFSDLCADRRDYQQSEEFKSSDIIEQLVYVMVTKTMGDAAINLVDEVSADIETIAQYVRRMREDNVDLLDINAWADNASYSEKKILARLFWADDPNSPDMVGVAQAFLSNILQKGSSNVQ